MTIGIAPVTGIPLPLVSYGGSSLLTTLILIGMLEAVHIRGRLAGGTLAFARCPVSPQPELRARRRQGDARRRRRPAPASRRRASPSRRRAILAAARRGRGPGGAARHLRARQPTAYDLEGADVLVYAVAGPRPSEEDVKALQLAARKRRRDRLRALRRARRRPTQRCPYVLDTDVIAGRARARRFRSSGSPSASPTGPATAAHAPRRADPGAPRARRPGDRASASRSRTASSAWRSSSRAPTSRC